MPDIPLPPELIGGESRIVVLTGAGLSAESGLETFRDKGGIWEKYDLTEVATPEAFARDPAFVLDFYNQRRRANENVRPNAAHHDEGSGGGLEPRGLPDVRALFVRRAACRARF